MRNIILLILVFVFINPGRSQSWEDIFLDIELFSHDLGYLDPLFVNIVFENKGNRKVKNINTLDGGLMISYKPVNAKKWESLKFTNFHSPYHSYKFDIQPNSSLKKDYFLLLPVLSDYSFFPGADSIMQKNKGLYEKVPGVCFKPGKYQLKITYFPFNNSKNKYSFKNEDGTCKKCFEKILFFEVGAYKKVEDIAAYKWLLTLDEPNFIYLIDPITMYDFPSSFDPGVKIYLRELLIRFPNSIFAPYAAYKSLFVLGTRNLTPISDHEKIIEFYKKALSKMKFIKENSKNSYLLKEIDPMQEKYEKELRKIEFIINQNQKE